MVALLLVLQSVLIAAGVALLWRKLARVEAELIRMRTALSVARKRAAAPAEARRALVSAAGEGLDDAPGEDAPVAERLGLFGARSAKLWPSEESRKDAAPRIAPEALRAVGVALLVFAPAGALAAHAPLGFAVAAALIATLGALALARRAQWRPAAWIGAVSAGAWALAAGLSGAAEQAPIAIASALTLAAAGGLLHARAEERALPGLVLAGLMGAAALSFGASADLISPYGAAFGAIAALAAIAGASAPRLEFAHVCAFLAACAGLLWVSGAAQAPAWLTPAAAWMGALFLGVAAVRAPQLGSRALLLAATGAAAPVIAVLSLQGAGQALADPRAAAAGLALVACALAAILFSAARRAGAISALGWTAWALGAGAVGALAWALRLAAPAPLMGALLALLALALLGIDRRATHGVWRVGALLVSAGAAVALGASAAEFLAGRPGGATGWAAACAFAAAAAAWGLASLAGRASAARLAALFEAAAWLAAAAAGAIALRALFSGGAPALAPVGFAEAGLLGALLAGAALAVFALDRGAARLFRPTVASLLLAAGLAASVAGAAGLLNPWWGLRHDPAPGLPVANLLAPAALAPALVGWAYWRFWRGEQLGAERAALGAALALSAVWLVLEARRGFAGPMLEIGPVGPVQAAIYALIAGAALGAGAWLWPRARR